VAFGIAVDGAGNAYLTGRTESTNFPTVGAIQSSLHNFDDVFVAKVSTNAAGAATLAYSTYLGGNAGEEGRGIAVDSSGDAYVTGYTLGQGFPAANAIQQAVSGGLFADAFITELNPSGTALVYSTFLGGTQPDEADAIAVDACGGVHVTGRTTSTDFPAPNGFRTTLNGFQDAFVAKLGETTLTLTSINVKPVNPTIAPGARQQFTATGVFGDCSTQDLTTRVTWSSGTQSVASISSGGLAAAVAAGTSVITATLGDVSGSRVITVANPEPIDFEFSSVPPSLSLVVLSSTTRQINLRSLNDVSEMVTLSSAWNGASQSGVVVSFSPDQVSVPSTGSVPVTVTITAPASPATGTLTVLATSASGVMRSVDVPVEIATSLPAPACSCTKTGAFRDPRVEGLVATSPFAAASLDTSSHHLTLTEGGHLELDHVSAFGFSPNGKILVAITFDTVATGPYSVTLYSVPGGHLVGTTAPLVQNALSWGFSPDDDNRYFLVASSNSLPTFVDVDIFDTSTGTSVMDAVVLGYSAVGAPEWTKESDVDSNDTDDDDTNKDDKAGGWGFGPDGRTFVLSYKTAQDTYYLNLWNLARAAHSPVFDGDGARHDVASFWQFSPCGDLFMFVSQAGGNPASSDLARFIFTSNGQPYKSPHLAPPLDSTTATVLPDADGSKQILLTGMDVPSISMPECWTFIDPFSPVNILLTDGAGRRTGFDRAANIAVNEIPRGSYSGPGTEPQIVKVPYIPGAYLLDAFGLDSLASPEPYTLTFEKLDASGDVVDRTEVAAIATRGTDQRYAFTVGDAPIAPTEVPVDTTPPSITCAAPDGQWHASDVMLACTASDSRSGLSNPGDASFVLSTHVAAGTETGNASTDSRQVCDTAGNCGTAGPIAGNKVDRKPPTIVITAPAGTYGVGQLVAASYSCADGGSGVASCTGSVPNGVNVNTSAAGTASLTVQSIDQAGNSASAVSRYTVSNASYKVCPLYDSTSAKKSGSAYPIKIQLCDDNGNNLSSPSIVVHAVGVMLTSTNAPVRFDDTGNANPDFDFRYDSSLAGYIFNLSTKGFGTGTYSLSFTAGLDPGTHAVSFAVR